MKNRYKKIVLEDENGIIFELDEPKGMTFEASDEKKGELIIRTLNIKKNNDYSEKYANPPIPDGYKHVEGEWSSGYVIERVSDGSQFVWIPVGYLDSDGTLNGVSFDEKFGRRNYMLDNFAMDSFNEMMDKKMYQEYESVKKNQGFYISRFNISKTSEGKPQSVKGAIPWVNINFYDAQKVASSIEQNENVNSHLTYGAEYDSVLAWFIKSKAKTLAEIAEDSTEWGNYWNARNSKIAILETGSDENWRVNNIYDLAGNVGEWTQEKYASLYRIIRGGYFYNFGENFPVAFRRYSNPKNKYDFVGFRATLYIK